MADISYRIPSNGDESTSSVSADTHMHVDPPIARRYNRDRHPSSLSPGGGPD